jgi:hypothetical protein
MPHPFPSSSGGQASPLPLLFGFKTNGIESLPAAAASASHHDPIKGTHEHPHLSPLPFLAPFHHIHAPSCLAIEHRHRPLVLLVIGPSPPLYRPFVQPVRIAGVPSSFCPSRGELPGSVVSASRAPTSPSGRHSHESTVDQHSAVVHRA